MTKPITVIIGANNALDNYKSGIITTGCNTSQNHGVIVVGWGVTTLNESFWIIMNSWGTTWGVNGYGYISMGGPANVGYCGINLVGSYPNT